MAFVHGRAKPFLALPDGQAGLCIKFGYAGTYQAQQQQCTIKEFGHKAGLLLIRNGYLVKMQENQLQYKPAKEEALKNH